MVTRTPDRRLVYLHCSSIFKGVNAQVRKPKKILQLLGKQKTSIKILTDEFTLEVIALVAKQLLDEQIFESVARARLHFPELFQASETQEAEREASEAEAARIEADAVQDIVMTSDEEGEEDLQEVKISPDQPLVTRLQPEKLNRETQQVQSADDLSAAILIPSLHPVYLPFRTQHRILTLTQSILEECCLDFGNAWVPDLMIAQHWEEVESIELTRWVKKFSKHAKDLSSTATREIAGRSLMQVLFATSSIRHSAVHRLPTSAVGILNMINAASAFTEALNDTTRAAQIERIKEKLTESLEDIIQHQTLLEHKLSDQLKDLARRKAEIVELEKLAVEDMVNSDKIYRITASSDVEDCLKLLQKTLDTCTLEENGDTQALEDDPDEGDTPAFPNPVPEEVPVLNVEHSHRDSRLQSGPAGHEDDGVSVAEAVVTEITGCLTTTCATESTAVTGENIPVSALENSWVDTTSSDGIEVARRNAPVEDQICLTKSVAWNDLDPNVRDNPLHPALLAGGASLAPAELVQEVPKVRHSSSSLPGPAATEVTAGKPPATEKYSIALKILHNGNPLQRVVSPDSSTKTAIERKALSIYSEYILAHEELKLEWNGKCLSRLTSVQIDGSEMELDVDDLAFLIQTISKTTIPTFTVQIFQTDLSTDS